MRPIKVFTDSCADLPRVVRDKYHISYFRLNFMKEGEEREADLDWATISPKELYDGLRDGDIIHTLPVTEMNYYKKMSGYVKHGYDIIYVACPEVLSKSIVKARRVAERVMREYPESRIEIIDSLNASMGQGMVAKKAARLAMEDVELDEIVEQTKAIRKKINQIATVETLTYLSRANRLNAASAVLGNIIGLKPILISDVDGRQTAYMNVRGRDASLNKVADLFADATKDEEPQHIYIMHADCIDDAIYMKELLEKRGVKALSYKMGDFGPIVGIATGPGTVCVFGLGKEVTFQEKH